MIQLNDQNNIVKKLDFSLPESIAVIVEYAGKTVLFVVSCVPPTYDKIKAVEEVDREMERLIKQKIPNIVTVVFNIKTVQKN